MKKGLILALSMVMVFGIGIGATLAYLSVKTSSVVNTFAYGDINIELWENDYILSSNSLDNNKKVYAEDDYKMVPGNTMPKNPTVTVKEDSEACWLFVKVEKTANFDNFMTCEIAAGWTELTSAAGTNYNVYYREVDAVSVNTDFKVLKDDQVSVRDTLLKTELNAFDKDSDGTLNDTEKEALPKLTFTAYAVQKANVSDVATAWSIAQNDGRLPAAAE